MYYLTRSTQRAQTSLAEADHYSHIAHCKNVEPWLRKTTHPHKKKKKKKKKVLDHYLHHDLGMLPLLRCFFAHLLILQYPDHHQNVISSSLYYSGPVHKISSQSVHNFLSNVVHRQTNRQTNRQTDRQTNQRYQKHNLLCQGGNHGLTSITSIFWSSLSTFLSTWTIMNDAKTIFQLFQCYKNNTRPHPVSIISALDVRTRYIYVTARSYVICSVMSSILRTFSYGN